MHSTQQHQLRDLNPKSTRFVLHDMPAMPTSTFHPFSRLPSELQCLIWDEALSIDIPPYTFKEYFHLDFLNFFTPEPRSALLSRREHVDEYFNEGHHLSGGRERPKALRFDHCMSWSVRNARAACRMAYWRSLVMWMMGLELQNACGPVGEWSKKECLDLLNEMIQEVKGKMGLTEE